VNASNFKVRLACIVLVIACGYLLVRNYSLSNAVPADLKSAKAERDLRIQADARVQKANDSVQAAQRQQQGAENARNAAQANATKVYQESEKTKADYYAKLEKARAESKAEIEDIRAKANAASEKDVRDAKQARIEAEKAKAEAVKAQASADKAKSELEGLIARQKELRTVKVQGVLITAKDAAPLSETKVSFKSNNTLTVENSSDKLIEFWTTNVAAGTSALRMTLEPGKTFRMNYITGGKEDKSFHLEVKILPDMVLEDKK